MTIKRGDLVEFTRCPSHNHMTGSGEVGVATESEKSTRSVLVRLADGSQYRAFHIHAHGWIGWMPEELAGVYIDLSPDDCER